MLFIGLLFLILLSNYIVVCSMPFESKIAYFSVLAIVVVLSILFKTILGV